MIALISMDLKVTCASFTLFGTAVMVMVVMISMDGMKLEVTA